MASVPAAPAESGDGADWHFIPALQPDRPFHDTEVPRHPAPGGFALAVVDGLWHLVPASLVGRAGATAGEVQLSATPPDALFYVRLPGLVAGKVDTPDMRFKGAPHPLIDRPPVLLPFKGVPWRLEIRGNALILGDGARSQALGSADNTDGERALTLVWAGDLDRDGRLDLVIDDWFDDGGTVCLWLSGSAAPGALVGQAACLDRVL
ncbi:MAG TPA: hypothetical protein VF457_08665 [Burkholderiaceae bacterium]